MVAYGLLRADLWAQRGCDDRNAVARKHLCLSRSDSDHPCPIQGAGRLSVDRIDPPGAWAAATDAGGLRHVDPAPGPERRSGFSALLRLGKNTEDAIADLAEEAASEQARAEVLERELSEAAGKVVSEFLMSDPLAFVPSREDKIDTDIAARRLAQIKANPERVLRGNALQEKLRQWEA